MREMCERFHDDANVADEPLEDIELEFSSLNAALIQKKREEFIEQIKGLSIQWREWELRPQDKFVSYEGSSSHMHVKDTSASHVSSSVAVTLPLVSPFRKYIRCVVV